MLVISLLLVTASACACAPAGGPLTFTDPSAAAAVQADLHVYEPAGIVPTFTEKPFWIVLGLVVLGWIVLAADHSDAASW
jgi:hypothetical protein